MRKFLFLLLLFSILLKLFPVQLNGQIIPDHRRIEWDPGLPDGIPDVSAPMADITSFGADKTGDTPSDSAFARAYSSLSDQGGVIFFPEGTYYFKSGIRISHDHIIIRGEGPNRTRLLFDNKADCIRVIKYKRGDWQKLLSGYHKGSEKIKTEGTQPLEPYEFAEIRQKNDPGLMYTDSLWDQSWSKYSVGQMFEIKQWQNKYILIAPSLNLSLNKNLNPQIRPLDLVKYVGIEDLYIEKLKSDDSNTLLFKNTAYCWVKNIESNHTFRTHVTFHASLRCEVRDSYFHHSFDYGGGGHGYGVECNRHSTNILVENNIFDSLRHAMIIQVGANGNVYGYNFSVNPVQGDGESNLNAGWIPPDISVHGHYPYMNLFEGNHVAEIGIADWWGPAGPGNTYFRNKVTGEGIFYNDHSHQQNLIGNMTTSLIDNDSSSQKKLEHGNVIDGALQWNDTITNHELPSSYYLIGQSSFLGDKNLPIYGHKLDIQGKLPAQERYKQIISEGNFLSCNITFKIKNQASPVNEAMIIIGEDTLITNSLGIVTFKSLPVKTDYSYTIKKEEYKTLVDSFTLFNDTTLNLQLGKSLADVKFEVKTGEEFAENVLVIVNEKDSSYTDTSGKIAFEDYSLDKWHYYHILPSGIDELADSLYLAGDTTIQISIILADVNNDTDKPDLLVFPVPAKRILNIESGFFFECVEILDITGRIVFKKDILGFNDHFDISFLSSGIYWLKVSGKEKKKVRKIIIE